MLNRRTGAPPGSNEGRDGVGHGLKMQLRPADRESSGVVLYLSPDAADAQAQLKGPKCPTSTENDAAPAI